MKEMTITLNVTDEDIANGKRGNHHLCPIALSAQRVDFFNEPMEAKVYEKYIILSTKGMRGQYGWRFIMSNEGREFISRYDSRKKVEPIKLIAVYEPWNHFRKG